MQSASSPIILAPTYPSSQQRTHSPATNAMSSSAPFTLTASVTRVSVGFTMRYTLTPGTASLLTASALPGCSASSTSALKSPTPPASSSSFFTVFTARAASLATFEIAASGSRRRSRSTYSKFTKSTPYSAISATQRCLAITSSPRTADACRSISRRIPTPMGSGRRMLFRCSAHTMQLPPSNQFLARDSTSLHNSFNNRKHSNKTSCLYLAARSSCTCHTS